jgi:hypothetical protein
MSSKHLITRRDHRLLSPINRGDHLEAKYVERFRTSPKKPVPRPSLKRRPEAGETGKSGAGRLYLKEGQRASVGEMNRLNDAISDPDISPPHQRG